MIDYISDFFYGATKYPCALFKPVVFVGRFTNLRYGIVQKEVHDLLLSIGFKRTLWQLVFPDQVAGVIRRVPRTNSGVNEYHIRFYKDGTIECELEVDRWSLEHWTGPRHHKKDGEILLKQILQKEMLAVSTERKREAIKLIGTKNFTDTCVRPRRVEG